jgi:hypothetical protein
VRPVVACALAALVAAVFAPGADAFHIGGQRWPGKTITYHSLAPSYAWSLAQAVKTWNASGVRVRFVKKPRARAQVVIHTRKGGSRYFCSGLATMGFVPRVFGKAFVYIDRGCDRYTAAGILAHELGHVLGLAHEDRRCATMNSALWAHCRDNPGEGRWRCRLVERDDVRGAVRLYGGSVKGVGPTYCWKYPPPPPPNSLQAIPNPSSGAAAHLQWRNTSNRGVVRVLIVRKRGSCPTGEADGDASFSSGADPGSVGTYEDDGPDDMPLEPGDYCYGFWSFDAADRTAGRATTWMTYEDVLPPPGDLAAQLGPPSGAAVRIGWTTAANPHATTVVVQSKEGSCPGSFDDPDVWDTSYVDALPGQPGSLEDWWERSGRWCFALWSFSDTGRHSRVPATLLVDFPER